MLVLLETKMAGHQSLAKNLDFDMIIQSPVVGLSGGIVFMWKEDLVAVEEVATTPQGIHAMSLLKGWETCSKASRWVVNRGNRVNFLTDTWIPNQPALRQLIEGPLTQNDLQIKVETIHNMGTWNTSSLSFDLPPHILSL
ncbi:hypothetical protein A4A49_59408, partial [Nicotiana attenuata]